MAKSAASYLSPSLFLILGFLPFPSQAQIRADVSVEGNVGTTVTPAGAIFTVTDGTTSGTSLFHSFAEFSVPTGGEVFFDNDAAIANIFSRVTGGDASNIDGIISANGNANLFLLNPNGITFGPNAFLQLPGSFLTTTADSFLFEGGQSFSATTPGAAPLLTINTPIGLQFGDEARPITVNQSNLILNPGEAIGLVGGDIQLNGGFLNTEGGTLSLGSVAPNSQVSLDGNTFLIDYANAAGFQDITLSQGVFADVSGDGGGTFQLQGRVIEILDESLLEASNDGPTDGGTVTVQASERLELVGTNTFPTSAIFADVYGTGRGNRLAIETGQLRLSQSAFVTAETFAQGASGGIDIKADEVSMFGNPDGDGVPTVLSSSTFASGQGGDLTITADRFTGQDWLVVAVDTFGTNPDAGTGGNLTFKVDRLALRNGAQVGTGTFGDGDAGSLDVTATESVDISGFGLDAAGIFSSGLFSSAEPGSTGNAGNLSITTPRLSIVQGGKVAVNTIGEGDGGKITIRAGEVDVADPVVDFTGAVSGLVANVVAGASGNGGALDIEADRLRVFNGGQVTTSTDGTGSAGRIDIRANAIDVSGQSPEGAFRSAITSSSTTDADAGSIGLESGQVTVREGAVIAVNSLGGGNGGNLRATAETFVLQNGTVEARTTSGSEGNLNIKASRALILWDRSLITTSATGIAMGGNITLTAPVIIGLGNSDIVANAVLGSGGNIQITTRGLFGLQFRPQLTPQNDITASSQFGLDGTVSISELTATPPSSLTDLPSTLIQPSDDIVNGCDADRGGFVVTGRGGLPVDPTHYLLGDRVWQDLRAVPIAAANSVTSTTGDRSSILSSQPAPKAMVEANNWYINAQGEVEFIAVGISADTEVSQTATSCATLPHPSQN